MECIFKSLREKKKSTLLLNTNFIKVIFMITMSNYAGNYKAVIAVLKQIHVFSYMQNLDLKFSLCISICVHVHVY